MKKSFIALGSAGGLVLFALIFLFQKTTTQVIVHPSSNPNEPTIVAEDTKTRFERIQQSFVLNPFVISLSKALRNASIPNITKETEPVAGGSCSDMQDYFNKNFGRRDTEFSNYEGIIESNVFNMLVCGGGVVIQTLPTGKKTCTAWIRVLKDKTLDWYSESHADCFVSQ